MDQSANPRTAAYRIGDDGTPRVVDAAGHPEVARLRAWLGERDVWVQDALRRDGALLFRGFDVGDAATFESVATAIAPVLRDALPGMPGRPLTEFVHPSSEVAPHFPLSQHLERGHVATPPARIFFGCLEAPPRGSGETPLADFRKVFADLSPNTRDRFEARGVRTVRNLRGPSTGRRPWSQERWDCVFRTSDRQAIEARCARDAIQTEWRTDDGLRLTFDRPASRAHPETGERVWHNQVAPDHIGAATLDNRRIFGLRPGLRSLLLWQSMRLRLALIRRTPPDLVPSFCTYGDGQEIPETDLREVWDAIWRHLAIWDWRRGDVLVLDNHAMSHGRFPYRGRRRVVTCLA